MARPKRKNADYFPFYAKDGRTLFILQGKYECKGTGFFTNVMRFLTLEENHHFCIANETDKMYFFSKCFCDEDSGIDMLNMMAKTGKIDKDLWESSKIIASQDLLDSLIDAYRKRLNDIITIDEIRVLRVSGGRNTLTTEFPAVETHLKGDNGRQSGGENTQTKLKETKLNQSGQVPFHFESHVGDFLDDILSFCEKIDKLQKLKQEIKGKEKFNPYMWVQVQTNNSGHPQAISESLEGLIKYWSTTDNPWTYANKIMASKSSNYHEADHIEQHQEFKKAFDIDPRVKEFLKPIGKT